MTTQRPFTFVAMAMSADGKIATTNRRVVSFGSRHDLRHLYQLRTTADAILTGARTVEQSDSILDTGGPAFRQLRRANGFNGDALRVLVSGGGTLSPRARIWKHRFSPIVVLTTEAAGPRRIQALKRLADAVRVYPGGSQAGSQREVDFQDALRWLYREYGVRRLMCEGGAEVNGALIRAGLVDQIHLTVCPRLVGGRLAPTIAAGAGFDRLSDAARFRLSAVHERAGELYLTYDALRRQPVVI